MNLTDALSLDLFELPTLEEMKKENQPMGDKAEWLHFFNHAHQEDEETMRAQYNNKAIHKAHDILQYMSADEETRRLAEIREDALRNEAAMLAAAERAGQEKGEMSKALETAENLLSLNILTVEQISASTGLPPDKVRDLKNARAAGDPK